MHSLPVTDFLEKQSTTVSKTYLFEGQSEDSDEMRTHCSLSACLSSDFTATPTGPTSLLWQSTIRFDFRPPRNSRSYSRVRSGATMVLRQTKYLFVSKTGWYETADMYAEGSFHYEHKLARILFLANCYG
jgi:hypothetical protein